MGWLAGWLGWLVADWLGWAGWAGQQVAHRLRGGARGAGLERSWELPGPAWAQARAWLGGPGPAQNKKWTTFPFIFFIQQKTDGMPVHLFRPKYWAGCSSNFLMPKTKIQFLIQFLIQFVRPICLVTKRPFCYQSELDGQIGRALRAWVPGTPAGLWVRLWCQGWHQTCPGGPRSKPGPGRAWAQAGPGRGPGPSRARAGPGPGPKPELGPGPNRAQAGPGRGPQARPGPKPKPGLGPIRAKEFPRSLKVSPAGATAKPKGNAGGPKSVSRPEI